ncbi:MAG: hypothetical protein ACK4S4_12520 [Pyrinomonadaceae bacterium]
MRTAIYLTFIAAAVALLGTTADAQRTISKRTTTKRTTTTTTKTPTLPPLEVRAARVKVSNQLANVTGFVARLGPIAQNIEALDAEARARKLKRESIDKNEADKRKVVAAIRGLREGLVSLETEFRTKPDLKKYLTSIQGISELAGQSEDSAIAGRFVAANAPLRQIQQKLNDTLALMPNAEL